MVQKAFGVETGRPIPAGPSGDDGSPGKVGSSEWNIWQHLLQLLATGRAAVLGDLVGVKRQVEHSQVDTR